MRFSAYKKVLLGSLLAFSLGSLFALDVNEDELKSAGNGDTVKFNNYVGPHSVINSADDIRAIGRGMGKTIARDPEKEATINPNGLYSVIHAVDMNDTKGLDADIILINKGAGVDHIDNVRRIITGFLMESYGYSRKDADTIAVFVTVYNAVYRNDLDSFSSKYKAVVLKYLTKEKCGLSTEWTEWAGNSQIVIPLYDLKGGISTIETSVISDKNVVSSMQETSDKGISSRKDMVDLKEREADNAEADANKSAQEVNKDLKEAQEAKKTADEASKAADDAQKAADDAQKAADQAKAESKADPKNKEKKEAASEAQTKANEAKDAASKAKEQASVAQTKADEATKAAQKAQENASAKQDFADKKNNEAQNERVEIAKDQQQLINEERAAQNRNMVAGLKIKDGVNGLYTIVKLDAESGAVVKESPVSTVRGRNIFAVTGVDIKLEDEEIDTSLFYLAICGENRGEGTVKLCLIDNTKLQIQKESEETVFEDSVLVKNGEDYYCVILNEGIYTIAKFDKNLKCTLKSSVEVDAGTPIIVTDKGIVVSNGHGKAMLLDLKELKQVKK